MSSALRTLSTDIALAILEGFDKHYRLFRERSFNAKDRFERADWAAVLDASKARIGATPRRRFAPGTAFPFLSSPRETRAPVR